MKRLLSILFSVDERRVILDSYITTIYHILWQNESQVVFVTIGYVFHSTDVSASCSQKRVYDVMSEIYYAQ